MAYARITGNPSDEKLESGRALNFRVADDSAGIVGAAGLLRPARCRAFVADPKIYDHLSAGTYSIVAVQAITPPGKHRHIQ